jgi:hypothetical protein
MKTKKRIKIKGLFSVGLLCFFLFLTWNLTGINPFLFWLCTAFDIIILINIFRYTLKYLIISDNDPMYNCEVYLKHGCSHIDGIHCDYPDCHINEIK